MPFLVFGGFRPEELALTQDAIDRLRAERKARAARMRERSTKNHREGRTTTRARADSG